MNTTLQIPMDTTLRTRATKAAKIMGFSSLQESIRVWLAGIVQQTPIIRYEEPPVHLSPKAILRYNKMVDDIESGRVKTKSFTTVDALMNDLNS